MKCGEITDFLVVMTAFAKIYSVYGTATSILGMSWDIVLPVVSSEL